MNNLSAIKSLESVQCTINKGQFYRVVKNPLKMIIPFLMRKLSIVNPVNLKIITGSSFYGFLPESIATMIWRYGYFDYSTSFNILKNLPKDGVFIDVGAHFGYFSSLAADVVGKKGTVVSIEAMPKTYSYLEKNMMLNKSEAEKILINKAAFNEKRNLNFNDYGVVFSSLNSAFGIRNHNISDKKCKEVVVSADKVDAIINPFNLSRVDVVKIDAESSEYFVIEGMRETLSKYKPILIVELGDSSSISNSKTSKDVVDLLKNMNYRPYELIGDSLVEVYDKEKYDYCNLVFKAC